MTAYKGVEKLCGHTALKDRACAYLYTRGAVLSFLRLLLLSRKDGTVVFYIPPRPVA